MVTARSDNEVEGQAPIEPGSAPAGPGPQFCARCGTSLAGCDTFCKACGKKIGEEMPPPVWNTAPPAAVKRFCNTCGAEVHPLAEICPRCGVRLVAAYPAGTSPKSRLTATLLCGLLGWLGVLGIHRLYLGKIGSGVTMLVLGIVGCVTWWFYGPGLILLAIGGIWQIVDFILLLSGSMTDGDGRIVLRWTDR